MSQIVKMTSGNFVLTKNGLITFSSNFVAWDDTKPVTIEPGTMLMYDYESKFKSLGLTPSDYYGYTFQFNDGVEVYANYDGNELTPVNGSPSMRDFNYYILFAVSDNEDNKLDKVPITDWDKTKPTMAPPTTRSSTPSNKIVTIVYDPQKGYNRARANDGIHGELNCNFPRALRTRVGQKYEVDYLEYVSGDKAPFYRAKGTPRPIY